MFVVVGGLAKTMDVVDGKEGVLVHGVAMIAIANYQGVNPMEFRDQHLKNSQGVHGSQRVSRVRTQQDFVATRGWPSYCGRVCRC